jgi:hypothetical protein
MSGTAAAAPPNPVVIFDALNGYINSMALKGAIELDIFTLIAEGAVTSAALAARAQASERGVRILCDFLAIHGFLAKSGQEYALTPVSGAFLNRHSPAYMGAASNFLLHEAHIKHFRDVAAVVRKGGSVDTHGNMGPDDPVWVEFARSMVGLAAPAAEEIGKIVARPDHAIKVLDIAAGHGLYGIAIARNNPQARVVGLDWKNVLEVA